MIVAGMLAELVALSSMHRPAKWVIVTGLFTVFGIVAVASYIAILGVAYKKDVDDPRESPSFKLLELLQARGANLSYNDPHIPTLPSMLHFTVPDLTSEELTSEYLSSQDCVVIATDHSSYDWDFIVEHASLVIDTRNATQHVTQRRERIYKA